MLQNNNSYCYFLIYFCRVTTNIIDNCYKLPLINITVIVPFLLFLFYFIIYYIYVFSKVTTFIIDNNYICFNNNYPRFFAILVQLPWNFIWLFIFIIIYFIWSWNIQNIFMNFLFILFLLTRWLPWYLTAWKCWL